MRQLVKAIRQAEDVRLVDTWYAEFNEKHNSEDSYNSEKEWKLISAVRVLQADGIICRKIDCEEMQHIAKIIKEEPDINIFNNERRQYVERK